MGVAGQNDGHRTNEYIAERGAEHRNVKGASRASVRKCKPGAKGKSPGGEVLGSHTEGIVHRGEGSEQLCCQAGRATQEFGLYSEWRFLSRGLA